MRQNSEIALNFDVDGVLCENNKGDYANAPPILWSIAAINKAYDEGYKIILCTARYGERFPGKQYQKGFLELTNWLAKYGVKYHELHFGKPPAALYVDDKGCKVDAKLGPQEWDKFWDALKDLNQRNQYNQLIEETNKETRINRKEEVFK